jgi:hypothetical protein
MHQLNDDKHPDGYRIELIGAAAGDALGSSCRVWRALVG